MAQGISSRLEASYRFPRLLHLHLKARTSSTRKRLRSALRANLPAKVPPSRAEKTVVTGNFDKGATDFRENGWTFVEGVWPPEVHCHLIEHWPPDRFLEPMRYVTKAYDTGFAWSRSSMREPEGLRQFPALQAAYDFLRSEEMSRRFSDLAGDGVQRQCNQLLMTRSYWGSNIIPHIDSSNSRYNINSVFFIDGTGGKYGGGLGIWKDNEFLEPIFIPENLTNTCLIYDMSEDFFHGFPPMRFGAFRWTINATYKP